MKFLDEVGLQTLWNRVVAKIENVVNDKFSEQLDTLHDIQQDITATRDEIKEYYSLIKTLVDNINSEDREVLDHVASIAKHGRAITKIAEQLNATYNDTGTTPNDEYTPGLKFVPLTQEEMDAIIEGNGEKDNEVYLIKE